MSKQRVTEILKSCDALLEGHFKYTSGRHGQQYFEKIRIAREPEFVDELGRMMASIMSGRKNEIDLVCAPAFGAIVFGFATALHLRKSFVFLQRDADGQMTVRQGFRDLVDGSRILLVEDVATTGGSIIESIEALVSLGGTVEKVCLIVDRTGGTLEFGVPYEALLTVQSQSWSPEECPLCARGIPISTPGSSNKK